jgi:hypothetical protein
VKEREEFIQVKIVTVCLVFFQQLCNEFFFPFKKNRGEEKKEGLNNQRLRSLPHATKPSKKSDTRKSSGKLSYYNSRS